MAPKFKLRARDSPPRAAFTFATETPPNEDDALTAKAYPRPPGDFLPERDMHMYGAQPLIGVDEPGRAVVRCERCGRAVLEWAAGEHRRICSHVLDGAPLTVKKGAKADKKAVDGKKRRASEASDTPDGSPSKKRARMLLSENIGLGSDDELDINEYKGLKKSEIKKILKERERLRKRAAKEAEKAQAAERRRARANNPLDYDRQCGVINDKGLPCSRSLTCKTHTVGAKRAVQGRTRPYDELFIEWQRAHNPNFKEPAPKRDREAKAAAAAAVAERKAAANKKRRAALLDEDGLAFDDDGAREMEELIRAARVAGERVRAAALSAPSRILGGAPAPSGVTTPRANGATSSTTAAAPSVVATPRPSPPFPSPWRTTTYEQLSMGDLLTKALAARPRPGPTSIAPQRIGSQSKPGPAVAPPLVTPAGVTA